MSTEPLSNTDVTATLRSSRELGPEYDDAIAASLVRRLDRTIEERVSEHVSARLVESGRPGKPEMRHSTLRLTMGIVSLGVAIPLGAIGGSLAGMPGFFVAMLGIVVLYLLVVGRPSR